LPPNFQRPLATKLCVRPPNLLEVQEHARGPLSPCQVWWGSDFTRAGVAKNVGFFVCLLPAALRAAQTCRYLIYSEADFEVIRPAGATRCTDGGAIWHGGGTECPLLRAKFHPHRCNDKGVGPPKLNFLLRFDRNVEYKRPAGAYPLRDFHKICRVCTSFQDGLRVKT